MPWLFLVCLLDSTKIVLSTCNSESGLIDVQLCCNRTAVMISSVVLPEAAVQTDSSVLRCYNNQNQVWFHEFKPQATTYFTDESFSIINATHCSWQLNYEDISPFPPIRYYHATIGCEVCKLGYSDENNCQNIDECYEIPHICNDTHAQCRDTNGSFSCTCKEGFYGNGQHCKDINECHEEMDDCDDHADCNNTEGSYECTCREGFRGNGTYCEDIDECMEDSHECHDVRAQCINSIGSYTCTCSIGFTGNGTLCENVSTNPGVLAVMIRNFSVSAITGIAFGTLIILGFAWTIGIYMSRIRISKSKVHIEDTYDGIKKFDKDFVPVEITCQKSLSVSYQSIDTIIFPMEQVNTYTEHDFDGSISDIHYEACSSNNRVVSGTRWQQGYLNIDDGQLDAFKMANSFISDCQN